MSIEKTLVEAVEFDQGAGLVVVHMRLTRASKGRCGICDAPGCLETLVRPGFYGV
jgi:hypothetical protein